MQLSTGTTVGMHAAHRLVVGPRKHTIWARPLSRTTQTRHLGIHGRLCCVEMLRVRLSCPLALSDMLPLLPHIFHVGRNALDLAATRIRLHLGLRQLLAVECSPTSNAALSWLKAHNVYVLEYTQCRHKDPPANCAPRSAVPSPEHFHTCLQALVLLPVSHRGALAARRVCV